ncbi:hypothetical protein Tco_0714927 [Tanacetum coccineum]
MRNNNLCSNEHFCPCLSRGLRRRCDRGDGGGGGGAVEEKGGGGGGVVRECESMIDKLKGKFNGMSIEINKKKELQQLEQAAKLNIKSELPLLVEITPNSPITNSLIMGDEDLSIIPEKESDEFIKSSVEDLVPILSESEDTFESDLVVTA